MTQNQAVGKSSKTTFFVILFIRSSEPVPETSGNLNGGRKKGCIVTDGGTNRMYLTNRLTVHFEADGFGLTSIKTLTFGHSECPNEPGGGGARF